MSESLPSRPHLDVLRKLAKQRLVKLREEDSKARLCDAQRSIANAYGFASWRKLVHHVNTVLPSLVPGFFEAVKRGDESSVASMLKTHPALANAADADGAGPLHYAAGADNSRMMETLIAAGADVNARYHRSGHTPLSWAVTGGRRAAAETLLKHKAPLDLWCAAGLGMLGRVETFFTAEGAVKPDASHTGHSRMNEGKRPIAKPTSDGIDVISDALYIAARNGHVPVVRLLLDRGADINYRGFAGGTSLLWAATNGHRGVIKLLLSRGADVNLADDWGTPLHNAAFHGHLDAVRLLVKGGADVNALNKDGHSAMEIALKRNHGKVAEFIRRMSPG